jgi:hypothetical protein
LALLVQFPKVQLSASVKLTESIFDGRRNLDLVAAGAPSN